MAEKKTYGKQVLTNSVLNLINMGVNRGGGLVFTIILARMLEPELFGMYNLALSIALIAITLANLGVDESLTKYVSSNYEKNPAKARAYFRYLTKIKIWILIFAAVILIIIAKPLSIFYGDESLFFPLLISSIYLVALSFSQFLASLFFTFKKVKLYIIKEVILQSGRIALLFLIPFFAVSFWVSWTFIETAIAAVLAAIFTIIMLMRNEKFLFEKGKDVSIDKRELFDYLKFLTIGSITGILYFYVDTVILGKFVDFEYIGFYRAATTIVLSAAGFFTITSVIYPVFAQTSGKRLNEIFNKLVYYSSILTIPASIGLIFVSKPFIRTIYGYDYLPAAVPLYILALLIFSFGTGDLFIIAMNSRGQSKYTAKSMVIATSLNVLLNVVFIMWLVRYGSMYAIVGSSIATIISRYYNVISVAKKAKRIGIKVNIGKFAKPFIASLAMALFLIIYNFFSYGKLNLVLGVVEIVIAMGIYFLTLYLVGGISKKEIMYVKDLVRENMKKASLSSVFE